MHLATGVSTPATDHGLVWYALNVNMEKSRVRIVLQ
jgi:hypothetical protein